MISENTQYNLSDGTALLLAPNIQYIAKHDPNNQQQIGFLTEVNTLQAGNGNQL